MFPEGLFPSIDGLHLEALHIDPQSITGILAVATPNATCSRHIFAERLGEALPDFARRTVRLTKALCAMAFAAGGKEGARLAHAQPCQ